MDNVTHSLTGWALSRAGLDRTCPRAVWLLVLSANAPDLDVVSAPFGALRYLEVHRGYTHSLLGLPFMAALTVVVVAAIFRQKLPWMRAWLLAAVGVASHLLLDWTNSYGMRFFIPFSSSWSHLDLNSLCDAWILLALAVAAVWPLFSRMVNKEIGDRRVSKGRAIAVSALTFFLLFDMGKAIVHKRVVAQLQSRLFEGVPPLQAAALPNAYNPLRWTTVVETPDAFRTVQTDALDQPNFDEARTFYKPQESGMLQSARAREPFRYFLYFARFPVWSLQPVIGDHTKGTRIDLTDLRFGRPDSGSFHCVGYADAKGALVEAQFTYGAGANLGWNASAPAKASAQ